jgi:hypothetical protein
MASVGDNLNKGLGVLIHKLWRIARIGKPCNKWGVAVRTRMIPAISPAVMLARFPKPCDASRRRFQNDPFGILSELPLGSALTAPSFVTTNQGMCRFIRLRFRMHCLIIGSRQAGCK